VAALTARAALSAGSTAPRPNEFVRRQFAIAVLVELLEGFDGIGDFIGVNDAIVIGIERPDQCDRRRAAPAARTAGTALATGSILRSAIA
jgi:hypothetical protein